MRQSCFLPAGARDALLAASEGRGKTGRACVFRVFRSRLTPPLHPGQGRARHFEAGGHARQGSRRALETGHSSGTVCSKAGQLDVCLNAFWKVPEMSNKLILFATFPSWASASWNCEAVSMEITKPG